MPALSSMFSLDEYPSFNNMHTRVQALGLAVEPASRDIYYISAAGPQQAVKSIYSSVCRRVSATAKKSGGNNGQIFVTHWNHHTLYGAEGGRFRSVYSDIPNSNYKHLLARATIPNLILCTDVANLRIDQEEREGRLFDDDAYEARNDLLKPHKWRIVSQFVEYLNAETAVPVLEKWGPTIWKHSIEAELITKLQTRGDCIGGWLIEKEANWTKIVQDLIQENAISILDIREGKPIYETRSIRKNGVLPDPDRHTEPLMLTAAAAG